MATITVEQSRAIPIRVASLTAGSAAVIDWA